MKIEHKYSIDYHHLNDGKHHFEFHISDDLFTLWEESELAYGELTASIEMVKLGSLMELEIDIEGAVMAICDRCLDEFMMPVQYNNHLTVRVSSHSNDDYNGDQLWINPAEQQLSLAQYLYESIVLSLPYRRVHSTIEECNAEMIERVLLLEVAPSENAEKSTEEEAE